MATKQVIHKLIVKDGRYIQLPPYVDADAGYGNLAIPDLSVVDTIQAYPLGARYVDGDRSYRYAKAGGTLRTDLLAMFARKQVIGYCSVQAATSQYATSLNITVAATDGHAADGDIAADALAGGYILIFDATETGGAPQVLQIKSNTATDGGGTMTIDVTTPINVALTTSDHAEVIDSPYSYVTNQTANNNQYSKVGRPTVIATSGQFLWVQTWGPCFLSPQTDVGVNTGGSGAGNNYLCVARHDGSIDTLLYNDVTHDQGQIVGHVIACGSDGGQGAPFVNLMMAP